MRVGAKEGAVTSSKRYIWHTSLNDNQSSNDFPLVPTRSDGYDDVANIKAQFAQGMAGQNWNVPFTSEDASYLMRKRDDQERALFDVWVDKKFDLTDPAQARMLQDIAPELYKRKEEMIDTMQGIATRYAKLRLRGPKTLDDLFLEWQVETGRVELPMGPVWNPRLWRGLQANNFEMNPNTDTTWNMTRYTTGLFSPLRWITANTQGWSRNPYNPADIYGHPGQHQDTVPVPEDVNANLWGGYPVVYPVTSGNLYGGAVGPELRNNTPAGQVARDTAAHWVNVALGAGSQVNDMRARMDPVRERLAIFREARERGDVPDARAAYGPGPGVAGVYGAPGGIAPGAPIAPRPAPGAYPGAYY